MPPPPFSFKGVDHLILNHQSAPLPPPKRRETCDAKNEKKLMIKTTYAGFFIQYMYMNFSFIH